MFNGILMMITLELDFSSSVNARRPFNTLLKCHVGEIYINNSSYICMQITKICFANVHHRNSQNNRLKHLCN